MPYPSRGCSKLNRERPKSRAKNLPKILEIRKSLEMQRDWWVQGKMWQGQLMQSIHYHKTAAKTGAHIQLSPSRNSEAPYLFEFYLSAQISYFLRKIGRTFYLQSISHEQEEGRIISCPETKGWGGFRHKCLFWLFHQVPSVAPRLFSNRPLTQQYICHSLCHSVT